MDAATLRVAEVQNFFADAYREKDVAKDAPLAMAPFETKLEVIAEPTDARRLRTNPTGPGCWWPCGG